MTVAVGLIALGLTSRTSGRVEPRPCRLQQREARGVMAAPTVSVLMAVYAGTPADQLAAALSSVQDQTRPGDEVVIVEDGPLSREHLDVISELERRHPRVTRVRLPVNSGQGIANQVGLEAAAGTWIAKADADDINEPERLEQQLRHLEQTGADVCGTAMLEFDEEPAVPNAVRVSPVGHDQISRKMRTNNPMSHPTVMYRRDLALACGGYPDMRFAEDYVLFARLWRDGAIFTNMPDHLVKFRADAGMHARRALRDQAGVEWRLQQELMACGLVSPWRRWWNLGVRLGYRSSADPDSQDGAPARPRTRGLAVEW